jgi:hypothetical protein
MVSPGDARWRAGEGLAARKLFNVPHRGHLISIFSNNAIASFRRQWPHRISCTAEHPIMALPGTG